MISFTIVTETFKTTEFQIGKNDQLEDKRIDWQHILSESKLH